MVARVFWILLVSECVANFVAFGLLYSQGGLPSGMAFLLAVPLIVTAIAAAVFLRTQSTTVGLVCIAVLMLAGIPSLAAMGAMAYGSYQARQIARGDVYFSGAAQQLAHALNEHDVRLVKQLIPAAGNLNQQSSGGMTLLRFAIERSDDGDASLESIRALLDGGADPKALHSTQMLPSAIDAGPRVTKLMLDAGVNPNVLAMGRRPLWWAAIAERKEKDLATLGVLLDNGADVHLRAEGGGPVSYAIREGCWRSVGLLVQRGAGWKEEMYEGQPVRAAIAAQIQSRESVRRPVPEELRKALAFYDSGAK